jgi:hypothetical protein
MKKQLLIAAVAATMGTAAIADVSITGQMKVNYKNTDNNGSINNAISHEANLYITGKSGDTSFRMELDSDSADTLATNAPASTANIGVEDIWMQTKIADVTIKAGTWNGSDSMLSKDSDRAQGKFALSTTAAGVGILVEGTSDANKTVKFSGDIAGVAASYKMEDTQDQITLAGSVSGVDIAYHTVNNDTADSDKTSISVSTTFNGVALTYVQADADTLATISGDSLLGDAAALNVESDGSGMASGDDISGFIASTEFGGNKVKAVFATVDNLTGDGDLDITKFVVTRSLASGSTLEVTYTDQDSDTVGNDEEQLDIELAVKF